LDQKLEGAEEGKLRSAQVRHSSISYSSQANVIYCLTTFIFRLLARLLSTANDTVVLSVAANDIGQYVKKDPSSKKYAEEILGRMVSIIELIFDVVL